MLDPFRFDVPHRDFYKLDNIRKAAEALDHPELGRSCILISGTNGKGSVAAYLTAWFNALGVSVGTYSSPHVMEEGERIRFNGTPISEAELKTLSEKYKEALSPLTYFERMTMLAFLAFRERAVDLQVLEVGIGGRLDATNISDPDISVITSIGLDHQDVLGEGYTNIAAEKAGVMRAGRTCFTVGPLVPEAKAELLRQADIRPCSLVILSELGFFQLGKVAGMHQQRNASLAYRVFQEFCDKRGWRCLSEEKAEQIALETRWSGRQQILRQDPVVLVDGGHNVEAIAALRDFLNVHFKNTSFQVIFGMMNDKDLSSFELIRPWVEKVYFPWFFKERQYPPSHLVEELGGEEVADLRSLCENLWSEDRPVLVCGSFYLAGEVLKIWKMEKKIDA